MSNSGLGGAIGMSRFIELSARAISIPLTTKGQPEMSGLCGGVEVVLDTRVVWNWHSISQYKPGV